MHSVASPEVWIGFFVFIGMMLALDLGVLHRSPKQITLREALVMSILWVALSLLFNLGVLHKFGKVAALEFLTGYVVEKALSVDNIFVFVILFRYFQVKREHQHRVLFFGILGAIIMRGIFIVLGASLIQTFHAVIYVFGVMLIYTGLKLLKEEEVHVEPENNRIFRLARRLVPAVPDFRGTHFFVRENGKLLATPLLFVLVAVETTDVVFAIDSIPAIFAITTDPFIVFTSNIFAILGLRALYFLLAGAMENLRFLRVGLAIILAFIGAKMLATDLFPIPIGWSLGVIACVLSLSVVGSLVIPKPQRETVG